MLKSILRKSVILRGVNSMNDNNKGKGSLRESNGSLTTQILIKEMKKQCTRI